MSGKNKSQGPSASSDVHPNVGDGDDEMRKKGDIYLTCCKQVAGYAEGLPRGLLPGFLTRPAKKFARA
jgi:hypothetical protein